MKHDLMEFIAKGIAEHPTRPDMPLKPLTDEEIVELGVWAQKQPIETRVRIRKLLREIDRLKVVGDMRDPKFGFEKFKD